MVKRKLEGFLSGEVEIAPRSEVDGPEPVAMYFSSNYKPPVHANSWKLFDREDRKRPPALATRVGDVEFLGTSSQGQGAAPPACKFALAVVDKQTRSIQYGPVAGGRAWRMEPHSRLVSYAPSEGPPQTPEQDLASRQAQYKRLVETFGSKKSKKRLYAREQGAVKADLLTSLPLVQNLLTETAKAAEAANMTKEEVMKRAYAYRNIPPHHPEATTAGEAYRLEELVPEGVLDALDTQKLRRAAGDEQFRSEVLSKDNSVPGYVMAALEQRAPEGVDPETRWAALSFLWALLQMLRAPANLQLRAEMGATARLAKRLKMKETVMLGLMTLFYSREEEAGGGQRFVRSSEQRQLVLLYILVTALIAEGYSLGPRTFERLRQLVAVAPPDLVQYYRELGCEVEFIKVAGRDKQFHVRLLGLPGKDAQPRTLGGCFPKPKLGGAKRRGGRS